MSASSAISAVAKSPVLGYAILGVVGIVAFEIITGKISDLFSGIGNLGSKAASAAGAVGTATLQTAGDFATGSGALTKDTPYNGDGILGSLGAATDKLFGGGLSSFGGWIGDKVYDATHDDSSVSLNLSNNGANNNPYGGGNNILYQNAVDSSPTPAGGSPFNPNSGAQSTSASPVTQTPLAPDFGVDPNSWG
jgi:hypothetical protein